MVGAVNAYAGGRRAVGGIVSVNVGAVGAVNAYAGGVGELWVTVSAHAGGVGELGWNGQCTC